MADGARGAAGFWILGGLLLLLPSSSIFPAEDLAADRRMYLPLLCFAALVGMALQKANWKLQAAYAVLLFGISVGQTRVWQLIPQKLEKNIIFCYLNSPKLY